MAQITIRYASIDGCHHTKVYKTLEGAQKFAQEKVGTTPDLGSHYAVSFDGIGKITVEGCVILDLFPEHVEAREAAMLAYMAEEDAAREAYLRDEEVPPAPSAPKVYTFDTVEEAEEAYQDAMESWHERYAEAGSSWVFGGGNPHDASLAAHESVGPKPTRAQFGLGPSEPAPAAPSWTPPPDNDIPF